LQNYDGALLLVSHDRHLLRQCTETLWLVADGRVELFSQGLDAYAETHRQYQVRPPRHERRDHRRRSAEQREALRPLTKKRTQLERAIDAFAKELDELTTALSKSATFEHSNGEQIAELFARHNRARKHLAQEEAEWLAVEERIETA